MRYCLCGELKTVFQLILMEPGQENEFADDMRGWAAHHKISGKTVDLLIKEGFDSMEALILIDSDDLAQTKIQRGQQKLLLKALLSLTSSGEETGSASATGGIDTAATADVDIAGIGTHADGTQGTHTDGSPQQPRDDIYTRLMAEHMRAMQSGPTTSENAFIDGQRETALNSSQAAMRRDDLGDTVGRFGTMPGSWQDPQIHLRSSASGRSAHAYHDIVGFVGKDTMEETVMAGMHEGGQDIIKSGVKPKLESLTLSQWSIANLTILYTLVGEGKLECNSILDYLSYTTKIYQLTQRYENVWVYFYDREYRKLQACHEFRWGTDIPHLHTMQLTPRIARSTGNPRQLGKQIVRVPSRLTADLFVSCSTQPEGVGSRIVNLFTPAHTRDVDNHILPPLICSLRRARVTPMLGRIHQQ